MTVTPLLHDAVRALGRHRLRSFLSTLGIVFAVVAVVSMLSIAEGAKQEILEQIEELGTDSIIIRSVKGDALGDEVIGGAGGLLLRGDAEALQRDLPGLAGVAPLGEVTAGIRAGGELLDVFAVTADYAHVKGLGLARGRMIAEVDVERRNQVCVIGSEASRLLGERGVIGESLRLGDSYYRIVGILRERRSNSNDASPIALRDYNRSVFLPVGVGPAANSAEGAGDEVSEIWLKVAPGIDVHAAAEGAGRILAARHEGREDFQVIVPQELLKKARKAQKTFNLVLGCIAGISLLVGGIGIMNTMLASVAERTKEIGIRRAVGAAREHIIIHFLSEAVVLTVAGGVAGILLGAGSAALIGHIAGWRTVLTAWSMLLAVAMAGFVGLASGLYPALRAAGLDPVEAIRNE